MKGSAYEERALESPEAGVPGARDVLFKSRNVLLAAEQYLQPCAFSFPDKFILLFQCSSDSFFSP